MTETYRGIVKSLVYAVPFFDIDGPTLSLVSRGLVHPLVCWFVTSGFPTLSLVLEPIDVGVFFYRPNSPFDVMNHLHHSRDLYNVGSLYQSEFPFPKDLPPAT